MSREAHTDAGLEPTRTVRSPSTIQIVYAQHGGGWKASCPELRSVRAEGESLEELQQRVRTRLAEWLRPDIGVIERVEFCSCGQR